MGKSTRLKSELEDVGALLEIISVLKDVSTNRFFTFLQQKRNYQHFFDMLVHFFELIKTDETTCPLIKNNNPGADILVITSEQGFMAQLNGKVSSVALEEYNKYPNSRLICIGEKGAEKCRGSGMKVEKIFPAGEEDRYALAMNIKNYLIQRVLSGETGRTSIIYLNAKTLGVLKARVVNLLPAGEIRVDDDVPKAHEEAREHKRKLFEQKLHFIHETNVDSIMLSLTDIWITARIFECVSDLQVVESAAMAMQLESAIEGLGSEKKSLLINYRKAGREELNGAMREVFTSTSMMKAKARKSLK